MKLHKKAFVLLIISLFSLINIYSSDVKEGDIVLAIQSLIVASASLHGLTLLTPPQQVESATLTTHGGGSDFLLTLDSSDVGMLKENFLNYPAPRAEPKGFFEMLLMSVTNLFPNYEFIRMYLQNQHLSEQEVILTGTLRAKRKATTYPFRYEGEGKFHVDGKRVSTPFSLDFSFYIPLEGSMRGEIIPIKALVDGQDALDIASSVFIID